MIPYPADHDISIAIFDHSGRTAYTVRGSCTGSNDGKIGPFVPEHDRQITGYHVDDGTRDEEGEIFRGRQHDRQHRYFQSWAGRRSRSRCSHQYDLR